MSLYNLKAKEIKTKRLVDVQILKDWYLHSDGYKVNDCIMGEKDFNTLYEVIDDTPIEKGWRGLFLEQYTKDTNFTDTRELSVTSVNQIMTFISQVETKVYKQGQADAYKKCAKMFRDMKLVCTHGCTKDNQDECEYYSYENMRMNETYEKYAQLIEKLI